MMHYRCMAVHTLSKISWQLSKKEDREQSLELKHMENNLMAYEWGNIHGLEEYASHLKDPTELFHNCRSHSLGWPFLQEYDTNQVYQLWVFISPLILIKPFKTIVSPPIALGNTIQEETYFHVPYNLQDIEKIYLQTFLLNALSRKNIIYSNLKFITA